MRRIAAGSVAAVGIALVIFNLIFLDELSVFALVAIALSPFSFVGALLILRVPRNAVAWLLGASGVSFALMFGGAQYAAEALVFHPGTLPGGELAAALGSAAVTPAVGTTVFMLLFFPTGRGLGGRWTWIERAFMVFVPFSALISVFKDVPLQVGPQSGGFLIPNPFAVPGPLGVLVTVAGRLIDTSLLPTVLLGPLSLVVRFRRSSSVEREQIKWLASSGTAALLLLVASNLIPGDLGTLLWPVSLVALGTLPIAIAVAIFRYRLYDIDLLINRTLVYGAMSAVLAGTYFLLVLAFETLLRPVTAGSEVAVALSTLAVVALFAPLRQRIQGAVDRRFYRSRYHSERTLDAFSVRLRDEVDLTVLQRELLAVIGQTVQPASVSVWLREPTHGAP